MQSSRIFSELSTDLLRRGCLVRFQASGRSMYPTIRDGETVSVAPATIADLKPGDIVFCRTRSGFVAHRLLACEARITDAPRLITRGDAHDTCDAVADASMLCGKVVAVERRGKIIRLDTPHARTAHRCRNALRSARSSISRTIAAARLS